MNKEKIIFDSLKDDNTKYEYLQKIINNFDKNIKYESILCYIENYCNYKRIDRFARYKTLAEVLFSNFENENKVYFDSDKTTLKLNSIYESGFKNCEFYAIINGKIENITINNLIK